MVVGEKCSGASWGSDVVLLVEATANLFPYVESIKTNYIVPTLEFFNGAPADDRYGFKNAAFRVYLNVILILFESDCVRKHCLLTSYLNGKCLSKQMVSSNVY